MASKKRFLFISDSAVPYQVKFCYALQAYFQSEFWFYESCEQSRPAWWAIDLGEKCKILKRTVTLPGRRFLTLCLRTLLNEFDPDIVMLGGFSIPSNYLAYCWAQKRKKRVVVFTERSRTARGELRQNSIAWSVIRWLYRRVDLVIVSAEDAVHQFKEEFGFGDKVVVGHYPADLSKYFAHSRRPAKPDGLTILYANRLIDIYDPLLTLEIFFDFRSKYSSARLLMNSEGPLLPECVAKIKMLGLEDSVDLLTDITSWEVLNEVYRRCDVLLLPAKFSNGNFTILEAMASGMGIVISNKVLGIGTLLVTGTNGFRVDPLRRNFVQALESYATCPELFSIHAEINRNVVRPFTIEGTAEHLFMTLRKNGLC
jgi:glycosyltransferase involved in cell wall biosynthesis